MSLDELLIQIEPELLNDKGREYRELAFEHRQETCQRAKDNHFVTVTNPDKASATVRVVVEPKVTINVAPGVNSKKPASEFKKEINKVFELHLKGDK